MRATWAPAPARRLLDDGESMANRVGGYGKVRRIRLVTGRRASSA